LTDIECEVIESRDTRYTCVRVYVCGCDWLGMMQTQTGVQ